VVRLSYSSCLRTRITRTAGPSPTSSLPCHRSNSPPATGRSDLSQAVGVHTSGSTPVESTLVSRDQRLTISEGERR
jgi:hypothetical protein